MYYKCFVFHFVIVQRKIWAIITFTFRNTNIKDRSQRRDTLFLVLLASFSKFIGERSGKLYDEETIVSVRAGLKLSRYHTVVSRTPNKRAWVLCPRKQVVYAWAFSMPSKGVISTSRHRRHRRRRRAGSRQRPLMRNRRDMIYDATWISACTKILAYPCAGKRSVLPYITGH